MTCSLKNINQNFPLGICLTLLLGASPGQALSGETASFPAEPRLADYLAWAENHNPALAGAADRYHALRHDASGAGALPDLKFAWGEMIVPVETRVGPQQRVLSLSQSIPWFGTLGLAEEVADRKAEAAGEGVRARLQAVHHQVRGAWFDLARLHGEIAILEENLDLARQAEIASRSAYEAGSGSFGDVLAAQIEVEELAVRVAGLRDRIRPVTAKLNLAAGLEADHPGPRVPPAALDQSGVVLPPDTVIQSLLEARNPDLAALRLEQEGRRRSVELAGKEGYPDLTLGVDYIMTGPAAVEGVPDSGKDPVIARLGLSIPLWGGRAGAEKKASAGRLAAAAADLTETRRLLTVRLEKVLYEWRQATRNVQLYGSVLLDSGRQSLEVTAARYRSGNASYVDLVTSRKTLLGLELARLRAAADRSHALNDLSLLLGVPITDLQAGAVGPVERDPNLERKQP